MMRQVSNVKIFRLIARLNTGGPTIHTILLTQGLNGDRFTSRLVTGLISLGEGDMGYYAERRGVVPILIPELGRDLSFRNDLRALWKVYRLICREEPDVIHTHTAKAGGIGRVAGFLYNIGRTLSGRSGTKLVHSFHGHIFHGYFSPWKSRLIVLVERLLALITHRVIAVSEGIKRDLVEVYRVCPSEKVRVVPIGVDLSWVEEMPKARRALRAAFRIPSDRTTVGIIGRLTEIKNHHLFLSAVRSLRGDKIHAVIVGDGELRNTMEQMVSELDLRDYVTFTGWQKDTPKIYADMDIVCLTSLNEGTPVVLIEAMAAGRPFVATDVGGIRDLMIGNIKAHPAGFHVFDNGILTPPNDSSAFAAALRFLIQNPDVRVKMGIAGQRWAQNKYSHQRLLNDIESLYSELLDLQPLPHVKKLSSDSTTSERAKGSDVMSNDQGARFMRSRLAEDAYGGGRSSSESLAPGVSSRHGSGEEGFREYLLKRPIDVVLSAFALVLSAPLWVACAVAIMLEDGGPVFHSQERWGRSKKPITVYKFRTMAVESDSRRGSIQARANDPRVTRVGQWLRATSLDELPQILNILRGEMSWVGPRALPINEIQLNEPDNVPDEAIPGFDMRCQVRPGLTGMAQIYAPRDVPRRQKFRYDRVYIRRQSFRLDLKLIALSLWISLRGRWEHRGRKLGQARRW